MEFRKTDEPEEMKKGRIEISRAVNSLRRVKVNRLLYDVFLICPVRNQTPEQAERIQSYIGNIEDSGKRVYYPARDTDQVDPIGFRICSDNRDAIAKSKEVHLWFDKNSEGSKFDLGIAWGLQKRLVLANEGEVKGITGDVYSDFILGWSKFPQGFELLNLGKSNRKEYDVLMIYPTRNQGEDIKQKMLPYVMNLQREGKSVYYPMSTYEQENPIVYRVSYDKREAVKGAKEVHVWYDGQCKDNLFDLGMAWALQKPLKAINADSITSTPSKSFDNVILEWNK